MPSSLYMKSIVCCAVIQCCVLCHSNLWEVSDRESEVRKISKPTVSDVSGSTAPEPTSGECRYLLLAE